MMFGNSSAKYKTEAEVNAVIQRQCTAEAEREGSRAGATRQAAVESCSCRKTFQFAPKRAGLVGQCLQKQVDQAMNSANPNMPTFRPTTVDMSMANCEPSGTGAN